MMKHFFSFLFLLFAHASFCQDHQFMEQLMDEDNRILVISGGGSRGAFAAGLVNRLHNDLDYEYQAVFGTSTGALIAPLTLLNKHGTLKEVYTTARQKDILDRNIVKKNGKIRSLPVFCAVLFGKKSVAGSKNLKKLIEEHYTSEEHEIIQNSSKEFAVTTVSLETTHLRYRYSHQYDYREMVDWIWASANQPVFMTAVEKPGVVKTYEVSPMDSCKIVDSTETVIRQHWVDGGLKENIPLEEAVRHSIEEGIENIDVIVLGNARIDHLLNTRSVKRKKFKVVDQLFRTIDAFSYEAARNDIFTGINQTGVTNKQINIFYIDLEYVNVSSLDFNPDIMQKMWDAGNEFQCKVESYIIDEHGNIEQVEILEYESIRDRKQ